MGDAVLSREFKRPEPKKEKSLKMRGLRHIRKKTSQK
jgi:hypothetical protein